MNKYHIEVIGSTQPIKEVNADYMDVYRDGCYVFKRINEDGKLEAVAYFPIYKTSIIEIEYDFNS